MDKVRPIQDDKDFIWNLWKRLQVAKPDITTAISIAVQREKDIGELRDRKILCILKSKDDKIAELESALTSLSHQLTKVQSSAAHFQEAQNQINEKNLEQAETIRSLENQIQSYTNDEISKDEYNRKCKDKLESDLTESNRQLMLTLDEVKLVKQQQQKDQERADSLQKIILTLESDVSHKADSFQSLFSELERSRKEVGDLSQQLNQTRNELESKYSELDFARQELADLWRSHNDLADHSSQQSNLIQQLYVLQKQAQTAMKSKEEAYTQESSALQEMYSALTAKYDQLKQKDLQMTEKLSDLKKRLLQKTTMVTELRLEVAQKEELINQPHNLPSLQVNEYGESPDPVLDFDWAALSEANHSTPKQRSRSPFMVSRQNPSSSATRSRSCYDAREKWSRHVRSKSLNSHVSYRQRSLSPNKPVSAVTNIKQAVAELKQTRSLLDLKNKELDCLKSAHNQRLMRLKSLQNGYNLLRQQLQTYEGSDSYG